MLTSFPQRPLRGRYFAIDAPVSAHGSATIAGDRRSRQGSLVSTPSATFRADPDRGIAAPGYPPDFQRRCLESAFPESPVTRADLSEAAGTEQAEGKPA